MSDRTALYRHFAADGTLLYVGISLSAIGRLCQHRERSAWYNNIARVDIEWLSSRELALEAEKNAIQTERPLHNVVHAHTGSWPAARTKPDPDRSWPIPASKALIAWNYVPRSQASSRCSHIPAVAVGHLLCWDSNTKIPDWTRNYECTGGAAEVYRRTLPETEQRFLVMRDYMLLVYTYGIDPHVVYRAFWNISEFQEIVRDGGMAPDRGEPGYDPSVGHGRLVNSPEIDEHRFWHSVHVFPRNAMVRAA